MERTVISFSAPAPAPAAAQGCRCGDRDKLMLNSYMVVSLETGLAVLEFFDVKLSKHINKEKYKVVTAAEYLAEFNREINDNKGNDSSVANRDFNADKWRNGKTV